MKLSICIPTYNRSELLSSTLESICSQLTPEVEVVVSDNASADATGAVVTDFQRRYGNVVYYRAAENRGADANFLKSVELASGEFCWLFGDDDYIRAGAVAKVLDLCDGAADIHVLNRVRCDVAMRQMNNQYWLGRAQPDATFRLQSREDLRAYLNMVKCLGGIFSFLGSIVVRRAGWNAIPYDERFIGTAYSHAFILMAMAAQGCTLSYHREPLVDCRFGNDCFARSGVARRIMIDLNGYGAIRDRLFADDPKTSEALNRVLHREYPWWRLAGRRIQMADEEWSMVSEALRAIGYSRRKLHCANVLGNSGAVVGSMLSFKRFVESLAAR